MTAKKKRHLGTSYSINDQMLLNHEPAFEHNYFIIIEMYI